MKLADGDSIVAALISDGQGEYFVTTNSGQTLRFSDETLRAQGRVGQGVAAMALGKGAAIISASVLSSQQEGQVNFLVVTDSGLVKKVPTSQYPQKGRATAGVVTTELTDREHILLSMLISEEDTLLVTSTGANGEQQTTVVKASAVKAFTRARKGVTLVDGRIMSMLKL
jgi:DNA gyrase subunit A